MTEQALWAGIAACRAGGRLSDIGHAVETLVRPHGYGLLEDYTGHGIGTSMHEPPAVPNLAPKGPGKGMLLEVGHVLAVEPMAVLGSADGRTSSTTSGPSSPTTGGRPRTGSTRWRSPTTARGC